MTAPTRLPFIGLTPDNFERLVLALARRAFRVDHAQQYGVPGQKQHGIDLYLRLAAPDQTDRRYVTIQCRNITALTPNAIAAAGDEFMQGTWADRTATFVLATRASTQRTELAEAIEVTARRLADSHIRFEVWDGERLSDRMRDLPDLVELYFGTATMEVFCIASPPSILRADAGRTTTTHSGGHSRSAEPSAPTSPGLSELDQRQSVPVPGRWRTTKPGPLTIALSNGVKEILPPDYGAGHATNTLSPPSVRIGVAIASHPLSSDAPSTSEIRRRFIGLLGRPPMAQVVRAATADLASSTWRSYGDVGRSHYGAILAPPGATGTPAAWARLMLPTTDQLVIGRDPRCTNFVIHADWSTLNEGEARPPADLRRWRAMMMLALSLPAAITTYLTQELRVAVGVDPMPVIGFWLATSNGLAQLIDVDSLTRVEGSRQSSGWDGYAVADETGQSPAAAATEWITSLCDDALHLDGYEHHLTSGQGYTGQSSERVAGSSL